MNNELEIKTLLKSLDKLSIDDLKDIYVQANKDGVDGSEEFKMMEEGDLLSLLIWRLIRKKSIMYLESQYKLLGIKPFDVIKGESDYACPLDVKILDKMLERLLT